VNRDGVRLAKILGDLTDCLCGLLATKGGGKTCWCGYLPGNDIAWDGCGECDEGGCGLGFITVNSVFPSSTLPNPDFGMTCNAPLAATLTVGALRCIPIAEQEMPDELDVIEAGLAIVADMAAIHEAIACCMGANEYVIGQYVSLGPEGGCAGGQWTVTVAL
jgi:hypothetical protein